MKSRNLCVFYFFFFRKTQTHCGFFFRINPIIIHFYYYVIGVVVKLKMGYIILSLNCENKFKSWRWGNDSNFQGKYIKIVTRFSVHPSCCQIYFGRSNYDLPKKMIWSCDLVIIWLFRLKYRTLYRRAFEPCYDLMTDLD